MSRSCSYWSVSNVCPAVRITKYLPEKVRSLWHFRLGNLGSIKHCVPFGHRLCLVLEDSKLLEVLALKAWEGAGWELGSWVWGLRTLAMHVEGRSLLSREETAPGEVRTPSTVLTDRGTPQPFFI